MDDFIRNARRTSSSDLNLPENLELNCSKVLSNNFSSDLTLAQNSELNCSKVLDSAKKRKKEKLKNQPKQTWKKNESVE